MKIKKQTTAIVLRLALVTVSALCGAGCKKNNNKAFPIRDFLDIIKD